MTNLRPFYYRTAMGQNLTLGNSWAYLMIVTYTGVEMPDHPFSWKVSQGSVLVLNDRLKRNTKYLENLNIKNYETNEHLITDPMDILRDHQFLLESNLNKDNRRSLRIPDDYQSKWAYDSKSRQSGYRFRDIP
jgi:hypothetical protein